MWKKENIKSQQGKTVIVTGANSGIGFQTALALYQAGAHVIVACRTNQKAEKTISEIEKNKSKGSLEAGSIDLSNLNSVKQFAENIKAKHSSLDLLINNAGVMLPPASRSEDGFELQFAVNFLGHFALTGHLYPIIKSAKNSRVVTVTSLAYTLGSIDFDNLRLEKDYDAGREYNQSKLADMLFTIELQNRIIANGDDIASLAVNPGVAQTGLTRNMTKEAFDDAVNLYGPLMNAEQGALSTLYAATFSKIEKASLYGPDQDGGLRGFPVKMEIARNALDKRTAIQLWEKAQDITGIKFP